MGCVSKSQYIEIQNPKKSPFNNMDDAPLSPLLNPLEGPNVELRKIEDLKATPDFQH
jgi:hypothetical protein